MQTGVILAIALIPAYVIVLSVAVNVFLYKNRPAFRNAFISPAHRIPATIRYLLPYPFSAYGLRKTSADSYNGGAGPGRDTRQRAELRPVTLPPVSASRTAAGQTTGAPGTAATGSATRSAGARTTDRVITRGGRRWGRTGSQRSTQTLPLYSEDVGDEDVVLIAKRESMRSMRSTRSRTAAGDEDIEEEGEELEDESQDEEPPRDEDDRESLATGIGASPDSLAEPGHNAGRARSDSIVSSTSIYDRGWGEAPAYEDAIQNISHTDSTYRASSDTADRSADITRMTTGASQVPLNSSNARRDSTTAGTGAGFRSFVNRLTGRSPASGIAGRYASVGPGLGDAEIGEGGPQGASSESFAMTGRSRAFSNASGTSQFTVDSGAPRPSASSGISRLRSHTGATNNSLVSLLLQPTITNQSVVDSVPAHRFPHRNRSGSNAASISAGPTSPSASVLNLVISEPLPGSVIRSAYNQPRAGFSTEQLKFLSSTESLGKYGANFGPEDASSGLGLSSHLHSTRSRSGSASSVGSRPGLAGNAHRQAQSSGSILGNNDDGLPSFDDLVREEEAAEQERRASVSRTRAGVSSEPAIPQISQEAVPADAQRSSPGQNVGQPLPPVLQIRPLPNFDLEVVPPTPITEENRRSFLNGQSVV